MLDCGGFNFVCIDRLSLKCCVCDKLRAPLLFTAENEKLMRDPNIVSRITEINNVCVSYGCGIRLYEKESHRPLACPVVFRSLYQIHESICSKMVLCMCAVCGKPILQFLKNCFLSRCAAVSVTPFAL